MKLLESIAQQSILAATEAVAAQNVIAKEATGSSIIRTAVNYDNIRMDMAGVKESCARVESPRQKIAVFIVAADNAVLTLSDFVNEITRGVARSGRDSYKHQHLVAVILNSLHRLCVSIKYELGLDTSATSGFSYPLLAKMTRSVREYLRGHSNKYVMAVRDYALLQEVVILANQMIQLIHMYSL